MDSFWKAIAGVAAAIVAIIGLITTTGILNPKPSEAPASSAPRAISSEAAPEGFRVVEAILRADPSQGTVSCPVVVTFSGRISVAGGAGTVSYRFIRSDGASAPVQTLTFAGPGSQDVSETWTLGASGASLDAWEAIKILDPAESESPHADFHITCS